MANQLKLSPKLVGSPAPAAADSWLSFRILASASLLADLRSDAQSSPSWQDLLSDRR